MILTLFTNLSFFLIILTLIAILLVPDTKKRSLIVIKFLMWTFFFLLFAGDDFLAITLLIIYVGAIAIMFLLAGMVINLDNPKYSQLNTVYLASGLFATYSTINPSSFISRIIENYDNPLSASTIAVAAGDRIFKYATLLTTTNSYEFVLCGIILTIGAIGLIVVCVPTKQELKSTISKEWY